jgi:hypothetical protein
MWNSFSVASQQRIEAIRTSVARDAPASAGGRARTGSPTFTRTNGVWEGPRGGRSRVERAMQAQEGWGGGRRGIAERRPPGRAMDIGRRREYCRQDRGERVAQRVEVGGDPSVLRGGCYPRLAVRAGMAAVMTGLRSPAMAAVRIGVIDWMAMAAGLMRVLSSRARRGLRSRNCVRVRQWTAARAHDAAEQHRGRGRGGDELAGGERQGGNPKSRTARSSMIGRSVAALADRLSAGWKPAPQRPHAIALGGGGYWT